MASADERVQRREECGLGLKFCSRRGRRRGWCVADVAVYSCG
jgi:hypothetical protein